MTGAPVGWLLVVAVVATVLAALLSAGEAAVVRASRGAPAETRAPRRASRTAALLEEPHWTAAAASGVGVVLEAVTAVSVSVVLAALGLRWWLVLLLALLVTGAVAVLVVRIVPAGVARRDPSATLAVVGGLLAAARVLARPLRPLIPGAEPVSDSQLLDMVDRAEESATIEADEGEMFRSVLELGDTITRAVMVPRTEMITLPSGTPLRKALGLFLKSGYSRVPVVGESVDDVVGVLYLKDVVRRLHTTGDETAPVDELVRAPVFVPESKPVDDLLHEMQAAGASHMAMVVDEFGGIAGLVTIEDVLEEIVGEVTDEHDRTPPEVEDLGDGRFRVPSRLPLDELGELFGLEIDDDDVDTAGGLLAKALGKVPLAGSSAEVAGLRLTADRVQGRRKQVATLLAERAPAEEEDA
jgi:CBS domain containing-hemolysin-like protein